MPENPWIPPPRPRPESPRRRNSRHCLLAVILLASLFFSASGGYLASYTWDGWRQKQKLAELARDFHQSELQEELTPGVVPAPAIPASSNSALPPAPSSPASSSSSGAVFASLLQRNPDVLGWLSIPAIGVDGPVVAGRDNAYYLRHDFDRAASRYGCLFLDAVQKIDGRNLTIYGHNLRSGAMFGRLRAFAEPAFLAENRFFWLQTFRPGNGVRWEIAAVFLIDAAPHASDFLEWREQDLTDPARLAAFFAGVHARALAETDAVIAPGDRLLSLVTCAYDFPEARLVVLARQAGD